MRSIFIPVILMFTTAGCTTIESMFKGGRSPYEQYISALGKAALDDRPMVRAWIEAGEHVMHDSVMMDLPFTESGFFAAGEPGARSYRFEMKAGQVLLVEGRFRAPPGSKVFLDLFEWKKGAWERVASADSADRFSHEFNRNRMCLLRVQPELLADVYYALNISATPALINPVSRATNHAIGSLYGDVRNGGRRSHEGVDIFAPRGTPVLAPTNGYILRTGTNNLGGKVIWMLDTKRSHSYYFAHLDSQLVKPGTVVRQGDTIGLVGNTGNARTTVPHLHFGIYRHGSLDPLYYIRQMEPLTKKSAIDTNMTLQARKVRSATLNLRAGPATSAGITDRLPKNTYVLLIGKSGEWYRIMLPDRRQGYLHAEHVTPLDEGNALLLRDSIFLLSQPHRDAIPIMRLDDPAEVYSLATYGPFHFVRTPEGLYGWVEIDT